MKTNLFFTRIFRIILLLALIFVVSNIQAQSSFMDRQAKIMKKETAKKVKRSSVKKKRYYARKAPKQQTEDVDNSSYYSGDVTSDEKNGLQYYTVSYDNSYKHDNGFRRVHIEIDFPVGNSASLDNSVRGWLYQIFEKYSNVPFDTWLSNKYEDESDALDKGEHLLEYYNEQIFNKRKKEIVGNNIVIDTIEISLENETSRYASFSCETRSYWSPSSDGHSYDYDNMTFRKSDGKRFGWDIIDAQKRDELKDTLASNLRAMIDPEKETEENQDYIQRLLNEESSLPKAAPYLTETGMEFDYDSKLGSGDHYSLELPQYEIKPFLTNEAIALAFDHVGAMTIDGINYDLDVTMATVKGSQNPEAEQITIPESVTLGDRKFAVTSLGDNCFENYEKLESIKLPSGLKSIGVKCFNGCTNLTNIFIPSTVTSIGSWCFSQCQKLQSISIPSSVTSMGDNCFMNCTSLTYASLSDNMTSLGDNTFYGCSALPTLSIPGNITLIGSGCFANCTKLSTIKISNGVTKIGPRCFMNCSKLLNVVLPSSIQELGESCFESCSSLTNIDIPYGIKKLSPSLLKNCTSLHKISLPASVKTIGEQCFSSCTGLKDVALPSLLESLGSKSFEKCVDILSIKIPNSVKSIGRDCFNECHSLSVVICYWPTLDGITFDSGEFSGIALKPVLFVPDDSKKFYKELLPWKNFDSIKELDPEDADKDIEKAKTKATERLLKAQKNLTSETKVKENKVEKAQEQENSKNLQAQEQAPKTKVKKQHTLLKGIAAAALGVAIGALVK